MSDQVEGRGKRVEPLRIGIVGAGAIAQRNAREAIKSGAAEIVAVYDVNHKVARDMSDALASPFCPTYDSLLERTDIEAVMISTPNHLHKPFAVQAAKAKKHVLVEKPIANTLKEADEMIESCKQNGVALTVNYSFRYLPKVRKAKEIIDEGALGEISGVQILSHIYKDSGYWAGARSNSPDDWRASHEKSGGGYLIMNVCHVIDYISFITGLRPSRVYSEYATLSSPAEVEDTISVTFRFQNGTIGTISASSTMRGKMQSEEIIWGTHGTLAINNKCLQFYSTRLVNGKKPGKLHKISKFSDISWTSAWIKGFTSSVRRGQEPDISTRQAWENLAFIQTAYQSLEKNQPLPIPQFNS